jgi:hypothetical protein
MAWAFVHAGGHIIERELQPGECSRLILVVSLLLHPACDYDIQFVGVSSILSSEVKVCSLPPSVVGQGMDPYPCL